MGTPQKHLATQMTTVGIEELFKKMKDMFNNGDTMVELEPSSPITPKYYDLKLVITGNAMKCIHLCRIINIMDSSMKNLVHYKIGDVLMSSESSDIQHSSEISFIDAQKQVAFSLIHEKVSEIPDIKSLFDERGRLCKRTSFQHGYLKKTLEIAAGAQTVATDNSKVAELTKKITAMKPIYDYGEKVLKIAHPQ